MDDIKYIIITNNDKHKYQFTLPINRIPIDSVLEKYYKFACHQHINNNSVPIEIIFPFSFGTMRLLEDYFYDFSYGDRILKEKFYWPDIYTFTKEQQFCIINSDLEYLCYGSFIYASINNFQFLDLKNYKYINFLKTLPINKYCLLLPVEKNNTKHYARNKRKYYATKSYVFCLSQFLCLEFSEQYFNQSFINDFKIINQIINPININNKKNNFCNEINKLLISIDKKITYLNELNDLINNLFNEIQGTKTSNLKEMKDNEKEYIKLIYKYLLTLVNIHKLADNNLIKTYKDTVLDKKIRKCSRILDSYDSEYAFTIELINYRLFGKYSNFSHIYFEERLCLCNNIHHKSSINEILNTTYAGCECKNNAFDIF